MSMNKFAILVVLAATLQGCARLSNHTRIVDSYDGGEVRLVYEAWTHSRWNSQDVHLGQESEYFIDAQRLAPK